MSLVTRQIGPDAKGSKLTFADMDNNLYYLQSLGVSGMTYSAGTLTLTNPTGGTTTVNIASDTNTFLTAATYNNTTNTITLTDNTNTDFDIYLDSVSGLTVNGSLSATTLYGDGSNLTGLQEVFVTGGTYSSGTTIFTNNTGGTFNINGYYTGLTDIGNILFVSNNGDDSTAQKGRLDKPWGNIHSAKSASTSGDTIYVFPGTYTYDNRSSTGNPWNGNQTIMNLWKNGITYYFAPNTKIILYNQTVSGQDLYLIRPLGDSFETCTILGHLDYEQYSTGPDSFNGTNYFFQGKTIGEESGYTFYAEVKSISSYHCEAINISRGAVSIPSDTIVSKVTIISEQENYTYLGGQSASGSFYRLDNGDNVQEFRSYSKYRNYYGGYYPWYISGNLTRSKTNFDSAEIYAGAYNLTILRNLIGNINITSNRIYYNTAYTPFGYYGSVVSTNGTGGWTCNLKADLIDYASNSQTTGIFYITTPNNILNFDGNIITNTSSGIGRFIAATTQPNTININGDIQLNGTGTTTQVLLQPNGGATINYRGKISGNYGGPLVKTYNGTMNINNSFITSTTGGTSLQLVQNGATSLGIIRINNSHVTLSNDSNPIINGNYVKTLINNSTIINSGTGDTISNSVVTGSLQTVNSMVISNSGATSISYTSTSPVISSNTTLNTNYNITDLKGEITILTDLIY